MASSPSLRKKLPAIADTAAIHDGVADKVTHSSAPGKPAEVTIKPLNIRRATFAIEGDAPLVTKRFSQKDRQIFIDNITGGSAGKSAKKKVYEPVEPDDLYNAARYISKDGWDGFPATAIRNAMIRACSIVDFKMTHAKMSIFVVQDGWDAKEQQIPLIRILGCAPVRQDDIVRNPTSKASQIVFRPAYHGWSAKVTIRWDGDQFSLNDVANLLARAGAQVGLCEGRPSSSNSAGMGWGTFAVLTASELPRPGTTTAPAQAAA